MTIQTNNGIELDLPFSVAEITYVEYCDFIAREKKYTQSLQQKDVADSAVTRLDHLRGCISIFCKNGLEKIPLFENTVSRPFLESFTYTVDNIFTESLTVNKIYAHIVNLIKAYKPVEIPLNFKFEWKGSEYCINSRDVSNLNPLLKKAYTVGESVTLLELQRLYGDLIDRGGDLDGNLSYNLGLKEFAVLCRKPDEELPIGKREREVFIQKRASIFADIPMDIVLDSRFFFLNIFGNLQKSKSTNTFLKVQKMKPSRLKIKRREIPKSDLA